MRERVPRHQRSSRSTIISEIEKRGLSRYAASSRAAHTFANIYCLPHRTSLRSRQQGTGKDAHGIDDEFKNHVQGTGGFSVFVVFFNLVATFLTGYIVSKFLPFLFRFAEHMLIFLRRRARVAPVRRCVRLTCCSAR
jgi:hypothetical protein